MFDLRKYALKKIHTKKAAVSMLKVNGIMFNITAFFGFD